MARRLDRSGSPRAIRVVDRATKAYVPALLAVHLFNVYVLNWLSQVRHYVGDQLLLDELLVMLPPLICVVAMWAMQFPIIRRVHEATLIRKYDAGEPVYPVWSLPQYLLSQARMHFVLLLLPVLIVLTWREAVEFWWPFESGIGPLSADTVQTAVLLAGVAAIFIAAPVLINFLWDTVPLAPGILRTRLEHLCIRHRVRIRRIMVWRTGGSIVNAAVMGVIAPVRYVLMTDALLDRLNDDETEAVMAHEVGHVRRHHVFWLLMVMVALFTSTGSLTTVAVDLWANAAYPELITASRPHDHAPADLFWEQLTRRMPTLISMPPDDLATDLPARKEHAVTVVLWLRVGSAALSLVVTLLVFGWASRRFERQADTFAVQHLSGMGRSPAHDIPITPAAVACMCRALTRVSEQSHVSLSRKSWRHGSMAWRLAYLASLPGTFCNHVSIDRQVRRIKAAAIVLLVVSAAISYFAMT